MTFAVVAQMADRIQVLRYGNTVEVAKTSQMLNHQKKSILNRYGQLDPLKRKNKK